MKNLDTMVYFAHKVTGFCIDMKYIKHNRHKTIRLLEGEYKSFEKDYRVKDIPFSEDWEIKIYCFEPSEYNRLMIGDIDKELNDKVMSLIDERIIKYGKRNIC